MSTSTRVAALFLCALLSGCASVSWQEATWHTLNAADIGTTMARCDNLQEANPIIGKDPTNEQLVLFGLGFALLYQGARNWIEENQPGGLKVFDAVTLTLKGLVVVNNANNLKRYC